MAEEKDVIEQKFGIIISRTIDKKSKKLMHVEMKTKSEGIPLEDVVIILEGWINRVKQELQKPFQFDKMQFVARRKNNGNEA
jgi:hypothetical protein